MSLQTWRFLTLLLAGFGLTMGAAHILEMAPKLGYDAELYSAVNTTMYRYFGIAGAVVTIGGILSAGVLAYRLRRRPSFSLALAGALALLLSFGLWLLVVAPVNGEVASALRSAPETVPEVWMRLRYRWEYGHLAASLAWITGFIMLLLSVLREIPVEAAEATETARSRTRSLA
jgi:hypothetical protein